MAGTGSARGLDSRGYIEREGALGRVGETFAPVVAAARERIVAVFAGRLHSAYLYGSIPRGTARPGRSDLDLLLVLLGEPTEADRTAARSLDAALDARFPQIDGAGTLLVGRAQVLSDLERYDLGWFVACLCTPLLGEDLAERLPRYRPDSLLARETNGDLALLLPRWRTRVAEADGDDARRMLVRGCSRRLVRTGFTLVMPRWNGWTSDLHEMAQAFGAYYPGRAAQMRAAAAAAGYEPGADAGVLRTYLDDLGPWLAEEYARVHGIKAPRPGGHP
ncbi:nucleotidyltransferase domain-containing protein [Streptomyces scabiei]|uniref:nucleotidyltransferase domain-containing protein n=1 Tax=Streptomyces scabiei TaxID=1930 RepID=UPI001F44DFD1|nr:nucleotidyltransferase domain-containing protein [Streptomyces scabiei]MDX2830835.1 nucleotidyltransferase domain-containing protein [Streptomyces scabiei]MDX3283314.1 nucleotidyltransferase domain-containing protein [Streptomyces scabiei]MDX3680092.1 nucleotidyltransferase domain-containing protein [Streptomyces scabiei]